MAGCHLWKDCSQVWGQAVLGNVAKDIASIAERHQMRIRTMLEHPTDEQRDAFDTFIDGLRRNLNPSIDREQAVEMLAQHVITKPVFDALFEGYAFTEHNPVSQSMQGILDVLKGQALEKDLDALEGFYASIRERVKGVDDPTARQKLIVELYDKFFKAAFPKWWNASASSTRLLRWWISSSAVWTKRCRNTSVAASRMRASIFLTPLRGLGRSPSA